MMVRVQLLCSTKVAQPKFPLLLSGVLHLAGEWRVVAVGLILSAVIDFIAALASTVFTECVDPRLRHHREVRSFGS